MSFIAWLHLLLDYLENISLRLNTQNIDRFGEYDKAQGVVRYRGELEVNGCGQGYKAVSRASPKLITLEPTTI